MATPVFNDWGNMSVLLLLLYYFAIKNDMIISCICVLSIHSSIYPFIHSKFYGIRKMKTALP